MSENLLLLLLIVLNQKHRSLKSTLYCLSPILPRPYKWECFSSPSESFYKIEDVVSQVNQYSKKPKLHIHTTLSNKCICTSIFNPNLLDFFSKEYIALQAIFLYCTRQGFKLPFDLNKIPRYLYSYTTPIISLPNE